VRVIDGLEALVDLLEEQLGELQQRGEKFEETFQTMLQGYGQGNGQSDDEAIDNCKLSAHSRFFFTIHSRALCADANVLP
jgi:hypothetical protein